MIVLTKTGLLARLAAAFRPRVKVYAFTHAGSSYRSMNVLFGIKAFLLNNWGANHGENLALALQTLKDK